LDGSLIGKPGTVVLLKLASKMVGKAAEGIQLKESEVVYLFIEIAKALEEPLDIANSELEAQLQLLNPVEERQHIMLDCTSDINRRCQLAKDIIRNKHVFSYFSSVKYFINRFYEAQTIGLGG
jgi:hypothetical protein